MKTLASATMLAVLLAGSATTAVAEENVHFGLLGGLNFSSATFHPSPSFDPATRNRVNVGGFVELGLTPALSLQVRGMYVQKGVGAEFGGGDLITGKASIDFVSFPVLFKAQSDQGRWKPYVVAGPEIGFKMNAEAVARALGVEVKDEDFGDGVESVEIAVSFGGGVEVPAGRVGVIAEAVYCLGLNNLVKIPDNDITSAKTRTFLLNFGVRF